MLESQPELGPVVRLDKLDTSYRRLVCGAYSVVYRVDPPTSTVYVIRVWHSARNPAELLLD